MPHCRLEYSGNLEGFIDVGELCRLVADTMAASELFEIGGIRVRAFRTDHHVTADAHPANGFIDLTLRIGTGRSFEAKRGFGDQLFRRVADHLAALFDKPHFALSFEIQGIVSGLSWKKNSMHARLRDA